MSPAAGFLVSLDSVWTPDQEAGDNRVLGIPLKHRVSVVGFDKPEGQAGGLEQVREHEQGMS